MDEDLKDTNSILNSMKKMLGMDSNYDAFDTDLIIHINSTFMVLNQLGVGTKKAFSITGAGETWDEFLSDKDDLNSVRSYMYLKLRLLFDPPNTSYVLDSLERQAKEYEWRLNVQAETEGGEVDDG